MRIRLSHVTNSSSSSFIIAKHKDCKKDDIINALNNMRNDIKDMLKSYGKYMYFEENDDVHYHLKENDVEKAVDLVIDELTDRLYDFTNYNPLILDYWECNSEEFCDDDGGLLGTFLMNYGYKFNCSTLKIG